MKKLILIATFAVAVAAYGQKSNLADTITGVPISKNHKITRQIPSPDEQVNVEQMKKSMQTSSLDALSGQVAGVQVQTTTNHEVMVNAVRVRGTTSLTGGNDPLVIIDGVASDLATLSTIYPPDIESITVPRRTPPKYLVTTTAALVREAPMSTSRMGLPAVPWGSPSSEALICSLLLPST